MTIFLTALHILFCFVLIIVILIQGGRGQGLSGASFSSGNVQSLFGTRAADFLTKATSVSAICFLFTCIGLNVLETRKNKSLLETAAPTKPVDMDAIKKALEKVKAEAQSAESQTAQAVNSAVTEAEKSAASVVSKASESVKSANIPAAGAAAVPAESKT